MKGELDWCSGMRDARREGHKEGLIEGLNKANLENVKKIKTIGFLPNRYKLLPASSKRLLPSCDI